MANNNERKNNAPSLEEVLVAFQKSLSRATQATNDASKHDPNFLLGQRTLFTVDALELELKAGIFMSSTKDDLPDDKIRINFEAPNDGRSIIKFKVATKPLEPIRGPRMLLSRLNQFKEYTIVNQFLAWFLNDKNEIEPNKEIALVFTSGGVSGKNKIVEARTDQTGRLTFSVDPITGAFSSPDKCKPKTFKFDPSLEWFVFAVTKDEPMVESIKLAIYAKRGDNEQRK